MAATALWLQDTICIAVLIACHWIAPVLSQRTRRDQQALASLGAGISLAYVFLHLIPQLTGPLQTNLLLVALLGITIPYTLNSIHAQRINFNNLAGHERLINFAFVNYIYAYSMPSILYSRPEGSVLYVLAIGGHILMADRTMASEHPLIFRNRLRWIGSAALMAGSVHSAILERLIGHPINDISINYASAFVTGGIIMTVFHEELPEPSASRSKWFILGLTVMTGLLLGLTLQ